MEPGLDACERFTDRIERLLDDLGTVLQPFGESGRSVLRREGLSQCKEDRGGIRVGLGRHRAATAPVGAAGKFAQPFAAGGVGQPAAGAVQFGGMSAARLKNPGGQLAPSPDEPQGVNDGTRFVRVQAMGFVGLVEQGP